MNADEKSSSGRLRLMLPKIQMFLIHSNQICRRYPAERHQWTYNAIRSVRQSMTRANACPAQQLKSCFHLHSSKSFSISINCSGWYLAMYRFTRGFSSSDST